jgi:pimeloyl-ACP methyl ester carboxylesterase
MSLNKFFYSVASLLLIVAAFTFASPFFVSPDLIYPVRVDSLYVKYESEQSVKAGIHDSLGKGNSMLFSPASLGMEFEKFDVKTSEGLILRGWYAACRDEDANTLLIIHDLSQSKMNYLDMFKQMHDRGLNVCAVDMRAHGNSDGDEFSPGMVAVSDVRNIFSELMKKPETNHIAVFGTGIGSAIAIQAASLDGRCEALIARSPFRNFSDYVENYSGRKWGKLSFMLRAVLVRELEKRLQYNLKELNLSEIIKYVKIPSLFICGDNDAIVQPIETYAVYDSSGATEKNLILVKKAGHDNIEQLGGEEYYNAIAQFIVNTIPKKMKETRFKKLAVR